MESLRLVVVEDDPGHLRLIEKNLRRAGIANPIIHLADGQAAMDFFFPDVEDAKEAFPYLILLDLNLPVFSGNEILERLKKDPATRHYPVIVLTTTDDLGEVQKCYEMGCNLYITKPVEYHEFSEVIRKLGELLSMITFPLSVPV
jgi:CheY-like chemotaxis protein